MGEVVDDADFPRNLLHDHHRRAHRHPVLGGLDCAQHPHHVVQSDRIRNEQGVEASREVALRPRRDDGTDLIETRRARVTFAHAHGGLMGRKPTN